MSRILKRIPIKKRRPLSYRQLWKLVNGAVDAAFLAHPNYIGTGHPRKVREAIVKRVVGAVHGYAAEVAKRRSGKTKPAAENGDRTQTTGLQGGGMLTAAAARLGNDSEARPHSNEARP